jgi:large subunit ribosomal protein L35
MPKMKSHSGAAKRFSRTASGKIKRHRANKQHILTSKTTKRKRQLRRPDEVDAADVPRIERLLPYL